MMWKRRGRLPRILGTFRFQRRTHLKLHPKAHESLSDLPPGISFQDREWECLILAASLAEEKKLIVET